MFDIWFCSRFLKIRSCMWPVYCMRQTGMVVRDSELGLTFIIDKCLVRVLNGYCMASWEMFHKSANQCMSDEYSLIYLWKRSWLNVNADLVSVSSWNSNAATQGHLFSIWFLLLGTQVCTHGDACACQIHPCWNVPCNQTWEACCRQAS